MAMMRLTGLLLLICSIAVACGDSGTTPVSAPVGTPMDAPPPTTADPGAAPEPDTTRSSAPTESPVDAPPPTVADSGAMAEPDTSPSSGTTPSSAPTETPVDTPPPTVADSGAAPEPDTTPSSVPTETPADAPPPTTTDPDTAPEPDTTEAPAPPETPVDTAPPATTDPEPDTAPTETAVDAPPPTAADPGAAPEPDTTPVLTPTETPVDAPPPTVADPVAAAAAWVAGINAAGWGFHRHLEGNAVSSPMSIGVAFSLARAGASASTGAALDGIFGFPAAGTHSAARAVGLRLDKASAGTTTLEVANRLFPDDDFSPLPAFLDTATARYGAAIEPIDTSNGAEAAEIINRWASESTRGLIPRIVSGDAVQDQELVLVNTVYLKADWVEPFLPEFTRAGRFTTGDGRSVRVPFMRDRIPVTRRFADLGDADAVELPYQGGQLAMWLIVPREPGGLAAVEETLSAEALTGLDSAARKGSVHLTMPTWEQELPPADLFGWLCPLGFCAGAAFDNIAPGIMITAALHGAKIIVDEKGTEAAAATAMAFVTSGPPPPDLTVVADRPFLWAIVHQDTGAILFVGRLVDPAA